MVPTSGHGGLPVATTMWAGHDATVAHSFYSCVKKKEKILGDEIMCWRVVARHTDASCRHLTASSLLATVTCLFLPPSLLLLTCSSPLAAATWLFLSPRCCYLAVPPSALLLLGCFSPSLLLLGCFLPSLLLHGCSSLSAAVTWLFLPFAIVISLFLHPYDAVTRLFLSPRGSYLAVPPLATVGCSSPRCS